MSARLRREALRSFRYALDQVLGCVTPTPSIVRQRPTSDRIEFEFETPGAFVPLRAAGGLGLRVRLRAQIGPEADGRSWRASITAYQYALHAADGREYLAYHWHPDGASPVAEPHLHLGPAASGQPSSRAGSGARRRRRRAHALRAGRAPWYPRPL